MMPGDWGIDHRLSGPMAGPVGMGGMAGLGRMVVGLPVAGPVSMPVGMSVRSPHMIDQRMISSDYYDNGYGYGDATLGYYGGSHGRRRNSHHYREYRHKQSSGPACIVM
jgi:hypothetical protein